MNFQNIEQYRRAAEQALEAYEFGRDRSISLLHRSENVTFLLSGTGGKPLEVMRVARTGYHTAEEIQAEIQWLDKLAEDGARHRMIRTAPVIRNEKGGPLTPARSDGQTYVCIVFGYLKGASPEPRRDETACSDFFQVGQIAAALHIQTMEWKESAFAVRPHWDYEHMVGRTGLFGDWRVCGELNQREHDFLERMCGMIKGRLERYGRNQRNYGLIHSDLRAANLLKDGSVIQVIDFDDCGFGWHLYDLAASVSFIEDDERVPQWIEAWLKGYQTMLPLEKRDLAEIPAFILARRIQLLAWIFSHDDSDPVKSLYPGFAEETVKLAEKCRQWYIQKGQLI